MKKYLRKIRTDFRVFAIMQLCVGNNAMLQYYFNDLFRRT